MTEPPKFELTLNPDGVAAPAQRIVAFVTEAVGTTLRALDKDDCQHDEALDGAWDGGLPSYRFTGLNLPADERRATFKNWALAKGFQDLSRGIRETLEEAVFFIRMVSQESGVRTTLAKIEAEMAEIRSGATTSTVDIYRDGVKLITTANDGAYLDAIGRSGTFQYRVCNLGSTTFCSAQVTAVVP